MTGSPIHTLADARAACASLHSRGPGLVVITSMTLADDTELQARLHELGKADHAFVTVPDGFDDRYCFRGTGRRREADGTVSTGHADDEARGVDIAHVPERVRAAAVTVSPSGACHVDLPVSGFIHILASERLGDNHKCYYLRMPHYDTYVSGTGDLTTALLLCWLQRGVGVKKALEGALGSVQGVLRASLLMKRFELSLIQARDELVTPSVVVEGVEL